MVECWCRGLTSLSYTSREEDPLLQLCEWAVPSPPAPGPLAWQPVEAAGGLHKHGGFVLVLTHAGQLGPCNSFCVSSPFIFSAQPEAKPCLRMICHVSPGLACKHPHSFTALSGKTLLHVSSSSSPNSKVHGSETKLTVVFCCCSFYFCCFPLLGGHFARRCQLASVWK